MERAVVGRLAAIGRVGSGGGLVVAVASLVGVTAFVYPFLLPVVDRTDDAGAHAADAPLIFAGLTVLFLAVARLLARRWETV